MLIKIDHDFHEHLTETEKKVINFINMNVEAISSMSISDVAEKTFSSPATVSRTIKKCGISGFAELRYLLTQETQTKKDDVDVNEIFNKSLLEVSNTIDHLSIDTILDVVKEIRSAKRIYLLSRGLSEHVAQEFALKLQILGFNVFENSDPAIMQEMTSHVKKQELVIIFSLGQDAGAPDSRRKRLVARRAHHHDHLRRPRRPARAHRARCRLRLQAQARLHHERRRHEPPAALRHQPHPHRLHHEADEYGGRKGGAKKRSRAEGKIFLRNHQKYLDRKPPSQREGDRVSGGGSSRVLKTDKHANVVKVL